MPKLTYTVAGETKTVEVTDSCSIGRMAGNTIALEQEVGASRRHCQILKIPSGYELSDLGSTNGTRVNGQTVKRHKLKDGDEIRIGDTALRWSDGTGAPAEEEVLLEGDVALEEPAGTPAAAPRASSGSSERCYLVFGGGSRDGQKIELDKKRITFGRNPKNTHVLADDSGVSGYHCEVSREGGAYVLRDLGSTNGTFVDGEQITELALQHGNRVRIGQTRLVFVDTAVSDFEKAMSAVEDLGSEWGMLRAEMDMTRVQQARRSQMVAIGGLLVVLAGAGYVAVAHPELIAGGEKAPTPVAGNLVADFSFESLSGTWAPAPGSPAQGRYADAADGPAFQGHTTYLVSRDGPPGRGAAVAGGEKEVVRVNPSSAYAFGARVRTRGDGQACVRVTWIAADGKSVVGQSATPLAASTEWTEVRGAVARPPRDAAVARLELVDAAGGSAYFDDVFFAPATDRPTAPEAASGEVALTATPDGQTSLRRGNVTMLGDAVPVAGILRAEVVEGGRRPDRVGTRGAMTVGGGGATVTTSGKAFDSVRGQWHDVAVKWTAEGERYVTVEADLPPEVALVATLPAEAVSEGLGVRTETAFFRMSDARLVEKVTSVTFGERNRFEVAAAPDAAPFRMAVLRTDDVWTVALGATDGKLRVRIDTDSRALGEGVRQLETAAADARAKKQYGVAIRLLRELAAKLPQGTPQAASAAKDADDLEKAGADEFARIAAERAAATEFRDGAELATLEARAAALVQTYQNHEIGEKSAAQIAAIQTAVAERRLAVAQRRAAPLLARAADYRSRDDLAIATAIWRGIVSAYPGTEAAAEAKKALDGLPAGK